jgi:hypothetical protein
MSKIQSRLSSKTALGRTAERSQFRGRLVTAGRTRNVLDEPGKIMIPAETLKTAVAKEQFDCLAAFIDHAGFWEGPSLHNLFGVWTDIEYNEETQSVDGILNCYENETNKPLIDILNQMLDEDEAPDLGVSIVFFGRWENEEGNPVRKLTGFKKIESADLVFMPAADGRILEALSAINQFGGTPMSTETIETARKTAVAKQSAHSEPSAGPDFVGEQEQLSDAWLGEIRSAGLKHILADSDLPEVVKKRLGRRAYRSPEDVYAAIQEAHEELQAIDRDETVELGSRPWVYVKDPQEAIRSHVEWFFGVEGAPLPPPNYRKLDQLYVAMTGDSEFFGVFQPEKVTLAAADTSTLAGMAVDAMNKVIMTQFSRLRFWRWYEQITYVIPNDGSVQDMKLITFGGVGNLPTVAEGAAYTELTVDDVKETAAFYKKGGYVGITLEMIRNSSIVEIQAVPKALAVAAVRTRSAAVSSIFTSNSGVGPTLAQDSTALFHASHNNIAATALGTDNSAWRAARKECFGHTEVNSSKPLAIFPKYLLVPDDLYDQALANLGYGEGMPASYVPEAQDRGAEDPRPVPLVVPDWTDAGDWAYIVDPLVYPVIQISYAQAPGGGSHPAPELYSVTDPKSGLLFTNDVLPIKVRDWFAVNVNGPRGIGKRNVA